MEKTRLMDEAGQLRKQLAIRSGSLLFDERRDSTAETIRWSRDVVSCYVDAFVGRHPLVCTRGLRVLWVATDGRTEG